MGLALTSADLARIEAASRALLSPLAAPDVDAWRQQAMRAVCDVLGAASGTFLVPHQPRLVATHAMDPWFSGVVEEATGPTWSGRGASTFPILDAFHAELRRLDVEVWDMHSADHVLGGTGIAFDNPWFHDVLRQVKAADTHALFAPAPSGSAMLTVHDFRRKPEPGEHLPVMSVLLPAFKAGLHALAHHTAHRRTLDALDEPLAAFDADGRVCHRTPSLRALAAADPEWERVEGALRLLARSVHALAFGHSAAPAPLVREVRTGRGRYTLRGLLVAPGGFGGADAFLVTVEPPAERALPTADEVRRRHGLTRREAEVALLVAEGLSNDQLAERLFVSPHTARHHVEAVLSKLGAPNRAAVAARLLQPV